MHLCCPEHPSAVGREGFLRARQPRCDPEHRQGSELAAESHDDPQCEAATVSEPAQEPPALLSDAPPAVPLTFLPGPTEMRSWSSWRSFEAFLSRVFSQVGLFVVFCNSFIYVFLQIHFFVSVSPLLCASLALALGTGGGCPLVVSTCSGLLGPEGAPGGGVRAAPGAGGAEPRGGLPH